MVEENGEIRIVGGTFIDIFLKDGATAVGINEPLVRYRISGGSKSGNKLRSARMTWRSYRYLGVGFFKRVKSFLCYCIHGVKRYWL